MFKPFLVLLETNDKTMLISFLVASSKVTVKTIMCIMQISRISHPLKSYCARTVVRFLQILRYKETADLCAGATLSNAIKGQTGLYFELRSYTKHYIDSNTRVKYFRGLSIFIPSNLSEF